MSLFALLLILASLFAFVAGQLLLKHAMQEMETGQWLERRFLGWFIGGIAAMTVSFFLSLGDRKSVV